MKISISTVFDCVMLHPGNVYSCLLSDVFFSLVVSIIIGTTFGVLGLVMVLWCIAFSICMKVSTCPLHNIYYKKTIQNLAETPLEQRSGV